MHTVLQSEVFLYPLLLPSAPFRTTFKMAGPNSFTRSEDMYVPLFIQPLAQWYQTWSLVFYV